ncbi:hypothetical protein OQA88_12341 [Cercophora sp. LCS_1]
MQSSDPGHFFETDAQISLAARRLSKKSNTHGTPIPLKSKLLASIPHPLSPSSVLIAESTGTIRHIDLLSPTTTNKTYRGPTTPISSLAATSTTLYAGCWDKTIWSWDLVTRKVGRKFEGHGDFVKALVVGKLNGRELLVSGGVDRKIIVWDLESGVRLHTLSDGVVNMMGVQSLVVDSVGGKEGEMVVVSASSDPHIRRWRVTRDGWEQVVDAPDKEGEERRTLLVHETTVYKLVVDEEEGDLWSGSGDGSVKCLARAKGWKEEERLVHGDHVRAVAVTGEWVVSAGRDEDIKFWDRGSGELYCTLEGHYDEVTELVVLEGMGKVVSVSIDGTVRSWPLDRKALDAVVEEQKKVEEVEGEDKKPEGGLLSAEEEAELAALMEDD